MSNKQVGKRIEDLAGNVEVVGNRIHLIRSQKVMLDRDLAEPCWAIFGLVRFRQLAVDAVPQPAMVISRTIPAMGPM
jgi:hypothetical protein